MSCAPPLPRLTVVDGRHRAASIAVERGCRTAVGADENNAVVVSDLAVDVAFALDWDGPGLTVAAVGADLAIDGRIHCPGRVRRLNASVDLASGGVSFRLDLPAGPPAGIDLSPSKGGGRRMAGFAAGVASTVALAATAALVAAPSLPMLAGLDLRSTGKAAAGPAGPRAAEAMAAAVEPLGKRPSADDALLPRFRGELARAGLDGVSVEVQADGALAASGRIVPAKGDAWRAAVRWFDTAARGRAVLVDRVEVSAAASALRVQAVYTGRNAYMIDGEGEKRFVGSSLPDGSVIQKIEPQRILVRRGEQTIAVRF